jgi:hypothetical protein
MCQGSESFRIKVCLSGVKPDADAFKFSSRMVHGLEISFSLGLCLCRVDAPFGLGRGVSMVDRVTLMMSGFKGKVFKDDFG